ncbi:MULTISPECIES: N-acetylneuraminate synthase family protein [unclassified Butyrivibrio]|jgi:N-acetylneuraminate synthase|uniref:N-acetylneuraminate synthase family protein n=1 Tax=unclassified Butyrivibrio TaxID=2639466 RepID=UPI00047D883F|nr:MULTISPECIES: N-acetylneuraminate synthase family protein [unclassified Butyrivibrio]
MSNQIKLGSKIVGDGEEPYFIAEIGINHNGDINVAKRLIDASYAIGWDCVKFQKRTPDIAVPDSQKNVMRSTPWGEMTYLEYKKRIEFEKSEYDYIDDYCKEKPISWTASPWDMPSLEFLLNYDVPFIKLASAANGNIELIKAACKSGKPILMSTGMCTQEELDKAVSVLEDYSNGEYALMHTNSVYPAPIDNLNLRYITTLKERYNCVVGYSGHEQNLEPTVAAVTLGANIIERHVTLSHNMWGTDQKASLEINAMFMLYHRCIDIIKMMGDGEKKLEEDELAVRKKLRVE